MKKRTSHPSYGRFSWVWLLLFAVHWLASCTTTHTAGLIKTMPMDFDLEKRVMWECKYSGAALGAVGGVVAGLLVGGLIGAAAGGMMSNTQKGQLMGGTALAGAAAGGIFGYQKGKEKGEKIVATAKEKDQLKRLVQGAKEYNSKIASYNAGLRKQLAEARKSKDKKKLASLKREATGKLQNVSARVDDRSAFAQKIAPGSRSAYSNTIGPLQSEQSKIKNNIKAISAAESPFSL